MEEEQIERDNYRLCATENHFWIDYGLEEMDIALKYFIFVRNPLYDNV